MWEGKSTFFVEKIQMTKMHYVSTILICQVTKESMKSCLSYSNFRKVLKEKEKLVNMFAYITYFTLLLG